MNQILVKNVCLSLETIALQTRASTVVSSTQKSLSQSSSSSSTVTLAKLWQKMRTFHSGSRARSAFIERDKSSLQSIGSFLLLEAEARILPAVPIT